MTIVASAQLALSIMTLKKAMENWSAKGYSGEFEIQARSLKTPVGGV